MKEKLLQYLDEIVEALRKGIDFAGEQAPLFIQELLHYYALHYGVVTGALLILAIGIFIFSYIAKVRINDKTDSTFWSTALVILGCIVMSLVIKKGLILIKVLVAPRLFLIEEITKLL